MSKKRSIEMYGENWDKIVVAIEKNIRGQIMN